MRRINAAFAASLLAGLGACTAPPPEAYVPGGSAATAASVVAIGANAQGEACRMLRSGNGAEILCGEWESPSARVREIPDAPAAQLAEASRSALAGRLTCDAPVATTVLGGQPAALMNCRRVAGGWPAFALVANVGGRAWQAEGVLPAAQPAERAIGVLAGVAEPDGPLPPSATLDLLAARLSREAFGTGDVARFEQLMTVGRDANQAERFATAETAYRAALGIQERSLGAGSPDTFAPLVRLALQISNQGRFAEAEALFARATPLAPRASDPLAPAVLAHYRGLHEANRHRTDAALASFDRAEALYARDLPPEQRLGMTATTRIAGLESGGTVADPIGSRALVGTIEVERNRAALLRAAGRVQEAEAASAKAARLAGNVPAIAGADLIAARLARTSGATAASAGNAGGAAGSFARSASRFARSVPRSRPYAETLLLRASVARGTDGPAANALPLCREAVAVLRELREGSTPAAIAPCVTAFAEAARETPAEAQALLAEGFEAAQLAQGNVTTAQIARAAARLAEGSRNPAASEAIRARETAERRLAELYRERDEATAAAGRGAGPGVAALDASIAEAQTAAAEADQAVQAAAPGFAQLVQSAASAREVMAALRPNEAMASVFLAPSGGWSFVLHDGRISAGRIGANEAEVGRLVARVRAGVESGDTSKPFDAEAAHLLHDALFAEVRAPLAEAGRIVVAPSGQLLALPFGLLAEAAPPAKLGHAGVKFLLDRVPVSHVPAPASLVSLRRAGPSQAARPWFGFGNPRPVPLAQAVRTFPAAPECGQLLASLPALPTAAIELRASAQLIGASPSEMLTGAEFTSAAVQRARLRDHRILHFATHGLLPGELSCVPEAAILASVPAGAPDASNALITAETVMNLDLDADAVLLSACNTGGGAAAGESLSGLARAFFYAGARSLLVTHWYINDAAATRIVAVTLDRLRQGQDLADALRAAQLDLARNIPGGSHPALWGAFALVGPGPAGRGAMASVAQ